jgi:predicted thioesterase
MVDDRRPTLRDMSEIAPDHERPSEPNLEPGSEQVEVFTVEGRLLTDVGGSIGSSVLSTPGMIAMMERCSSILSYKRLPVGKATVGFEVCIKHVAAAPEGSECRVRSVLREVVDGRKLRFDVEVTEGERTIGVGTHERRVIDVGQLG